MKKLILALLVVGFLGVRAHSMDSASISTYYDVPSKSLLVGVSSEVYSWQLVSFDVGVITDISVATFSAGASLKLDELAKHLGSEYLLNENIKVGLFSARDFRDEKWLWGLSLSTELDF